jgi:AI-2 transport protein TqsA
MMTTPSRPSDRRVQTACLLILTLIATGFALDQLKQVLVPFVLALFFSQCLTPMIDTLMRRFRWPRMVAVTMAAIIGAALIVGVAFLLGSSISGMAEKQNLSQYESRFQHLTDEVATSRAAAWIGIKPGDRVTAMLQKFQNSGVDLFGFVGSQAKDIAQNTGVVLINTAVVLILMAFLLFGRQTRRSRFAVLNQIEERVQRYISLTVGISILTGVLVGSSLSILQVQFAAGFGFLAFVLNFIPNLGAVVTTLLPLPFVFLDPHLSIVQQLLALVIPAAIQVAIGSFVQPRIMGQSLDLHPVVLILSLLFFTMIWGLGGAFLATPVTAVIKIVFEKIPATRPLAAALAGNLDPLAEMIESPGGEQKKSSDAREIEAVLSADDALG